MTTSELLAKKEASRLSEGLQSSPTSFDSIGTQIDQQINLVILSVRKKGDNDAQVSNPLYNFDHTFNYWHIRL